MLVGDPVKGLNRGVMALARIVIAHENEGGFGARAENRHIRAGIVENTDLVRPRQSPTHGLGNGDQLVGTPPGQFEPEAARHSEPFGVQSNEGYD